MGDQTSADLPRGAADGAGLVVDSVTVRYGPRVVLDRVSLDVGAATTVALLGPSGSGKSTLLRVIAGIVQPESGRVSCNGVDVSRLPTHRRRVGMVFQDEQLFPHLDVAANIGFGLSGSKADRAAKVAEMLELVGLGGYERRRVTDLSGGEAKRVALARSLAPTPHVVLLDEPLTGLDTSLHDRLADEIRRILATTHTTAVLVTHDLTEADRIADRAVNLADCTTR